MSGWLGSDAKTRQWHVRRCVHSTGLPMSAYDYREVRRSKRAPGRSSTKGTRTFKGARPLCYIHTKARIPKYWTNAESVNSTEIGRPRYKSFCDMIVPFT